VSYHTLKSKISGSNSSFRCRTALLIWFIGRKLASAIILRTWPDAIKRNTRLRIYTFHSIVDFLGCKSRMY
jgi:hypothetical protein